MMDPLTGQNRGYAFITYCNREAAQAAVKQVLIYISLLLIMTFNIGFFSVNIHQTLISCFTLEILCCEKIAHLAFKK